MKIIFTTLALCIGLQAQASMFSPFLDKKLNTGNWKPLYAGQTQLDGMDVAVVLEAAEQQLLIPDLKLNTRLPQERSLPRSYRLTLVAMDQPTLQVSYPLELRRDLALQPNEKMYISTDTDANITFTVHGVVGNTLSVEYKRKAADSVEQGNFEIVPMMHTM